MRTPIDYKNCILLRGYNRHFVEEQSDDIEHARDAKLIIPLYFVVLIFCLSLFVFHALKENGQAAVMNLVVGAIMLSGFVKFIQFRAAAQQTV